MSLNKLTATTKGYDLGLNVGCDALHCKTLECDNPPWNHGAGYKLEGGTTYNNLDVSGINHLYINEVGGGGSTAVINGLAGGVEGQLLTITAGSFGGFVQLNHNNTTGAPNEQNLYTQTQANITIPNPPTNYNGVATLQYVASQNKWLCHGSNA